MTITFSVDGGIMLRGLWLTPHVCSWHGLVKVSLQICDWSPEWIVVEESKILPQYLGFVFKWVASRPLWILWLPRSFQPNLGWRSQKLNDNLLARMAQCLWVDFAELIPKVGEMFLLHWCAKSLSSVGWKTKLPSIKYIINYVQLELIW